ncbi:hypothetical protein EVC45_38160 [Paraburkholderia sp. UYCP14C]|uniref:hypothetical protein n=1 Tax=Paraburkholderia sp. UYCP14C TaxID=2511130 RepID=UPI00102231FF|nr:hypothetical protein [Paraburkholderia sp. UYCP14C]RZF24560.1 hypothetical protein EVC45_38160 [Paraburkholderia sp. UYCP14C]
MRNILISSGLALVLILLPGRGSADSDAETSTREHPLYLHCWKDEEGIGDAWVHRNDPVGEVWVVNGRGHAVLELNPYDIQNRTNTWRITVTPSSIFIFFTEDQKSLMIINRQEGSYHRTLHSENKPDWDDSGPCKKISKADAEAYYSKYAVKGRKF